MHLAVNAYYWDRPDTGSGQYTRQLVTHLTELAPSLRISLVHRRTDSGRMPTAPSSCQQHLVASKRGHWGKVLFEQVGFPRACRRIGADLAHVPYWGSPLRSAVPAVVTVHDLIPLLLPEYRGGMLGQLYTSLVSAAARGAQWVVTDSVASKNDIVAHLGIPAGRISAIHLAADSRFRPGPPNRDVAAKYGLPDEYVLYLGSFDLRKNVTALLNAYSYIGPAIGDRFPLVLAGRLPSAPSRRFPDLRTELEELGIEDLVHITGYIDERDKPAVYRGAAALVQLSHYEGFGLTALEAMACGTPVVVSNRSSLPEVVGSAGFCLEPDDLEGIAGAVIACATDESLRADMRQRGLEQAARFSWAQTASQTLQVYSKVLG